MRSIPVALAAAMMVLGAFALAVEQDYVYLAALRSELAIVDASDAARPFEVELPAE